MSIIKRLFLLWDKHTIGFIRVLLFLALPVAFWKLYAVLYFVSLLILRLIVKAGYEKKWDERSGK